MRRLALTVGLSSLLVLLGGCGNNADERMEKEIAILQELADAYESDAPQSKIDEITKRLSDNHHELDAMKLAKGDKKRLLERYEEELDRVRQRLAEAERQYKYRRQVKTRGNTASTPTKQ
jgi:hypothetical protein